MGYFAEARMFDANWFRWEFNVDPGYFAAYVTVACLSALLLYVLTAILMSRLFAKAGIAKWKAWVPVLNLWKMLQIGGQHGAWSLFPVLITLAATTLGLISYNANRYNWSNDKTVSACLLVIVILAAAIVYAVKYILAAWNITKKLDKSGIYMILLLVNLGPSLWLWILALDKSKWNDKLGKKSLAPEMRKKSVKK